MWAKAAGERTLSEAGASIVGGVVDSKRLVSRRKFLETKRPLIIKTASNEKIISRRKIRCLNSEKDMS